MKVDDFYSHLKEMADLALEFSNAFGANEEDHMQHLAELIRGSSRATYKYLSARKAP